MITLEKALYLLPVGISDAPLSDVLPSGNIELIRSLKCFIVENLRTARRFLKKVDPGFDIGGATFFELNEHTDPRDISSFLEPLRNGVPTGVMSEAGCPAVADPGSLVVEMAWREGLRVIPLVGPSSILMSLMASGFNGQGFSFHGYLPIEEPRRAKTLRDLESDSARKGMTQIFIEAPYRVDKMLAFMLKTLRGDTKICVACDVTDPENERIVVRTVSQMKKDTPVFGKRPAIFLIYAR